MRVNNFSLNNIWKWQSTSRICAFLI